jgi:hypothetical protein
MGGNEQTSMSRKSWILNIKANPIVTAFLSRKISIIDRQSEL